MVAVLSIAAMLATDAKFWGVIVMGAAVVILFFLPWLDYSPVKSIRYRPGWHKTLYGIFFANFVVLGYLGTQAPTDVFNLLSQIGTLIYLGFFFLMPVWSRLGTAEIATDPMGIELTDIFMTLEPRQEWTRARTQQELAAAVERFLRACAFLPIPEPTFRKLYGGVQPSKATRTKIRDSIGMLENYAEIDKALAAKETELTVI